MAHLELAQRSLSALSTAWREDYTCDVCLAWNETGGRGVSCNNLFPSSRVIFRLQREANRVAKAAVFNKSVVQPLEALGVAMSGLPPSS